MKREDMIKERTELTQALFNHMFFFFKPIVSIVNGVGRLMFLDEEIRKSTPIQKPEIVKEETQEVPPNA